MSKLIIIRGNSGSGKTSVSKALQKKFGNHTMLLSQDVIRREMLYVKDGADTKALPLLMELLRYGYEHCETVILEGILRADWYLPLFESAKNLFGKNIYAYYYDIPFEETVSRHMTREKRNEFGEETLRKWWNEKDYLTTLSETLLSKEYSLQETVDMIYNEIVNTKSEKKEKEN